MSKAQMINVQDLENFDDIGAATAEMVTEPELYPDGPWTIRNVGGSKSDATDRDGNEQLMVTLRYEGLEPGPEVDPELVEQGGYEGKTLWVRRYISKPVTKAAKDGSLARFFNFVALHGVDTAGLRVDDAIPALKGATINTVIGTRSYTDKNGEVRTDNTTSSFASAE